MGQTDSQFKAFIRFILDDIKELQTETDEAKRASKMEKIVEQEPKQFAIWFQNLPVCSRFQSLLSVCVQFRQGRSRHPGKTDEAKRASKMEKIVENLQKTLED